LCGEVPVSREREREREMLKVDEVMLSSEKKIKLDKDSVEATLSFLEKSPTLYSYWRSSCSWRVRIALELKNIKYDYVPVHLVKNEQMSQDYVKLNPSEEVPTLCIDGNVLTQSVSIVEYLEETRPEIPLLPKDVAKRAQVRAICDIISCGIQPVQNLRVLRKIMGWYDDADEKTKKKMEWGRYWIELGFKGLEKVLSSSAGRYCVGDNITMADLCLVPQVYNANRFKVDMSQFPIISRIDKTLSLNDAFKRAHPSAQPDAS
jgi:maleylacetoacetate isomerase